MTQFNVSSGSFLGFCGTSCHTCFSATRCASNRHRCASNSLSFRDLGDTNTSVEIHVRTLHCEHLGIF